MRSPSRSLRALLVGRGRMGQAIAEVLAESGHVLVARCGRGDDPGGAIAATADLRCDVAFEFTVAAAAPGNVTRLIELGIPTVCGTTGWDPATVRALADERRVPLVVEPNFSLGVAVLRALVREASARLLSLPEYEAGIFECHHGRKADAPSGTAIALRADAEAASGRAIAPAVSLRLGGQPGEHQVFFDGPDESLELVHRARSRRLFAAGAVRAAEWLVERRPRGAVRLETLMEEAS